MRESERRKTQLKLYLLKLKEKKGKINYEKNV